jgi:hypothetical protein
MKTAIRLKHVLSRRREIVLNQVHMPDLLWCLCTPRPIRNPIEHNPLCLQRPGGRGVLAGRHLGAADLPQRLQALLPVQAGVQGDQVRLICTGNLRRNIVYMSDSQ